MEEYQRIFRVDADVGIGKISAVLKEFGYDVGMENAPLIVYEFSENEIKPVLGKYEIVKQDDGEKILITAETQKYEGKTLANILSLLNFSRN